MILTFEIGGEIVRVQVTSERELFWKGKNTNDQWVEFDKVARLSKQDTTAIELTKLIVQSLPTNEDVAKYVTYELRKAGLQHLGTQV